MLKITNAIFYSKSVNSYCSRQRTTHAKCVFEPGSNITFVCIVCLQHGQTIDVGFDPSGE